MQVVYMRQHAAVLLDAASDVPRPSWLEHGLVVAGVGFALANSLLTARVASWAPGYFVVSGFCWFLSSLCAGLYACALLDGAASVVSAAVLRVGAAPLLAAAPASGDVRGRGAADMSAALVDARAAAAATRALVESTLAVAFARKRGAQALAHCIFGGYVLHLAYGIACAVSTNCDPGYYVFLWMSTIAWRLTISASRLSSALCALFERCVRAGPHVASDCGMLMQCLHSTGQLAISAFGFSV